LAKEHVHGYPDERVLRDPLTLSPTLAVEHPAEPRQLVQLVGAQAQFLALEPPPLRSL
jgi:hypothetical protein